VAVDQFLPGGVVDSIFELFHGCPLLLPRLVAQLASGQLEEHVLKVGRAVHHPQPRLRRQMLQQFGDLNADYRFSGSSRLGYSHNPGGWRDPGVVNPTVPLQQTLDSGFVGGGNPETTPGSFLFNSDNILWQTALLQPVGGMDRIWQRLLVQEIPPDAIDLAADDPRAGGLAARDAAGKGKLRYVGDLVRLNHRVTAIHDKPDQEHVAVRYAWSDPATGKTGEAVATGFVLAAETSCRVGWLDAVAVARVRDLVARAGLPVTPPRIGAERARALMSLDKKVLAGRVRLVLLRALGDAVVTADYDRGLLASVLQQAMGT
jgi:hypothetical protein